MDLKKLGRFEIIDEIGSGGMGLVYKGRDPKINRMVALKVIRPTLGGKLSPEQQQAADRFYIEAQAAGSLSHKNIVTIYDVGEEKTAQGPMVYIAMEFLEGKGLDWYIANKKLATFEEKVRVVRQIADGLDYAHKRNVIHRDIKPANILVSNDLTPKITDFGLARLSDSSLTMSGTILGTPNYMAPEQVQGKKVDARSDLFSLMVVFYEILTGEKPFGADSITSVIYKVVNEEPLPPRRVNIELPPKVDSVIKKGLAKNPDNRYQDGQAFIAALDDLLEGDEGSLDTLGDTTIVVDTPSRDSGFGSGGKGSATTGRLIGLGIAVLLVVGVLFALFSGGEQETDAPRAPTKPTTAPTVAPTVTPDDTKPTLIEPSKVPSAAQALPSAEQSGGRPHSQPAPQATPLPTPQPTPQISREETGYITVTTEPKDAEVFLDGKFLGLSPINKLAVGKGTHVLTVSKGGYNTYSKTIRLGSKGVFTAALMKSSTKTGSDTPPPVAVQGGKGTLKIYTPSGSQIVVDGREYTDSSLTLKDLSPGTHQVYVGVKGKKPYTETFSIDAGGTKTINLR